MKLDFKGLTSIIIINNNNYYYLKLGQIVGLSLGRGWQYQPDGGTIAQKFIYLFIFLNG